MGAVQWSEDLSVGCKEIDTQHRALFALAAQLEAALDEDRQIVNKVIRELNSYYHEHFTTEERWMAQHRFPALAEHILEHEAFVEKLLHFELEHLAGNEDIAQEILDYLTIWLREHILGYDMHYAVYIRSKEGGA